MSFVWGLILGPFFIAANTVVHQVSDDKMRGKVFSGLEMVVHFAFLLTMLLRSYLAEHIERFWILVSVGALFAVVGMTGLIRYPRLIPLAGGAEP